VSANAEPAITNPEKLRVLGRLDFGRWPRPSVTITDIENGAESINIAVTKARPWRLA
jgi:hypothetical protein